MDRGGIRGAAAACALALAAVVAAGGLTPAGAQVGRAQTNPPPPPVMKPGRVRTSTMSVELPTPVAETPVPCEKLEAQEIEGVPAEGTRLTVTIPAGEFDNEQPLEITHEQWYSPELRMVVLLKHNDPRFGETVFRLTNITRTEPSPELFAEPQGYRAEEERGPVRGRPMMRRP